MELIVTAIVIGVIIIVILVLTFWNIPIYKRKKKKEKEFIEKYGTDYAIFFTSAFFTHIDDWIFFKIANEDSTKETREQFREFAESTKHLPIIRGHWNEYWIAIPEGTYNLAATFDYLARNYSTGYTQIWALEDVYLQKGCLYNMSLDDNIFPWISKEYDFETIASKDVEIEQNADGEFGTKAASLKRTKLN